MGRPRLSSLLQHEMRLEDVILHNSAQWKLCCGNTQKRSTYGSYIKYPARPTCLVSHFPHRLNNPHTTELLSEWLSKLVFVGYSPHCLSTSSHRWDTDYIQNIGTNTVVDLGDGTLSSLLPQVLLPNLIHSNRLSGTWYAQNANNIFTPLLIVTLS